MIHHSPYLPVHNAVLICICLRKENEWEFRNYKGKCHKMRERGRAGKGGERRPCQGLQELPHSQLVHTLVLTGKISWLPLKQRREAQTAACHMVCNSLSATSHSCKRTAYSNHHAGCILSKLVFSLWDRSPLSQESFTLKGKGGSSSAVLPPVACGRGRVYSPTGDLGSSGYPQRMLQGGKPLVVLCYCEGPSLQHFLIPTATLVVAALQIPSLQQMW